MSVRTSVELDNEVYESLTQRIGQAGLSDFINQVPLVELRKGNNERRSKKAPLGLASEPPGGYFDRVLEEGQTVPQMAARTRQRLTAVPKGLLRADFPPQFPGE